MLILIFNTIQTKKPSIFNKLRVFNKLQFLSFQQEVTNYTFAGFFHFYYIPIIGSRH